MRNQIFILVGATACVLASAAGVNTATVARSGPHPTVSDQVSNPIFVHPNEVSIGSSRAWSAAHLQQGYLRVATTSDDGPSSLAYASASFSDRITFTPASYGQSVRLHWAFYASLSANLGGGVDETFTAIQIVAGSARMSHAISNGRFCVRGYDYCNSFPSGTVVPFGTTGTIEWTTSPGPLDVFAGLYSGAYGYRESADASHTALFYLEVPAGVVYTSESGVFLANASPVPEVNAGLMIGMGLLILLLHRRVIQNLNVNSVFRLSTLRVKGG